MGRKPKEESKKFPEYYKKNFPSWSLEQCEKAAKKFRKSCNSLCLEYWVTKYPNLSNEECENLRKEHLENKKSNNPNYLQYYVIRFPDLSKYECEKKLQQYRDSINPCIVSYWKSRYPEKTIEECEEIASNERKRRRIKSDNHGENNPMHRSRVSLEKTKECSPMCIEFYRKRYPDLSKEEQEKMWREKHDQINHAIKNAIKDTNIEYYLNQGMSEDEAKKALHDRQSTFSLKKCIKKYGEEDGLKIYKSRQEKWLNSLNKHFKETGNKISKPYFRSSLQESIENKLKEIFKDITSEFYIFDEKTKRGYSYDIKLDNKLIEINGDYWHANPKLYDKDFIVKSNNKEILAKDIWIADRNKKICAKRNNFKIMYVWESDYNLYPEKEIKRCIKFLQS